MNITAPLCAILAIAIAGSALAHDHANNALDDWYRSLTSPGGGACCDGPGVDALKVEDPDWRMTPKGYQVKLDGEWIDVPDDRIVKKGNLAGAAIVWPIWSNGKRTVRCFLPGSGS